MYLPEGKNQMICFVRKGKERGGFSRKGEGGGPCVVKNIYR